MRHPVPKELLAFVVALTVVAACAEKRQPPASLALACQVTKCTCVDSTAPFMGAAKTVPVLWQKNGDASCPQGFELRRVATDKERRY